MNYKKTECVNCGKEFRQVLDHAWIIHCSKKCIDEHTGNGSAPKENDKDLRKSA